MISPAANEKTAAAAASAKRKGAASAAKGSAKKKTTEGRKDRKAYSTAGRPRVRGEYKCGKCGFMPKKQKHDCAVERARFGGAAHYADKKVE